MAEQNLNPQGYNYGLEPKNINPFWGNGGGGDIGDININVYVGEEVGTPYGYCEKYKDEETGEWNLDFYFENIKGEQGESGASLTPGQNIQIEDGVISATDTTYTAGSGIDITNGVISATGGGGSTYTNGYGIDIASDIISLNIPTIIVDIDTSSSFYTVLSGISAGQWAHLSDPSEVTIRTDFDPTNISSMNMMQANIYFKGDNSAPIGLDIGVLEVFGSGRTLENVAYLTPMSIGGGWNGLARANIQIMFDATTSTWSASELHILRLL